jgi:hypothetical protein
MASDLPVKPVRRSFVAYWKNLYGEHYKAILGAILAVTGALSAGASGVNGQGEPIVAFAMIALSCVFAILAAIAWKGVSKRSTLTWIIRVGGLIGFFVWSAFSAFLTWKNKPKDKWTNLSWDDVAIVKSYIGAFLNTGWKPILLVAGLVLAFMLGRRIERPVQTTGTVKKPFSPEWLLSVAEEDKKELQKAVKIYAVNCETHFTDGVPHVDFTFWIFSMALAVVFVDDLIVPPIMFWPNGYDGEQHKMRREPIMDINHAKPCLFRWPSKFTITQDVTPDEVTLISNASDKSFFRLAALKITMHGDGFFRGSTEYRSHRQEECPILGR